MTVGFGFIVFEVYRAALTSDTHNAHTLYISSYFHVTLALCMVSSSFNLLPRIGKKKKFNNVSRAPDKLTLQLWERPV